jgi:hypothetical protein
MTTFDTLLTTMTPRWTPNRTAHRQPKKENIDLIEFGQTILNIELNSISRSPFMTENKMWVRSSFASDRNSMTFKNQMLDRYRHLGDTLTGGRKPPLRVFGSENAAGFSGIDMYIRLKKGDGSFSTLPGLLAFLPLDTDDCEECFQFFSFNAVEPKTLVHIAGENFQRHVIEACAREVVPTRS